MAINPLATLQLEGLEWTRARGVGRAKQEMQETEDDGPRCVGDMELRPIVARDARTAMLRIFDHEQAI
eukprot:3735539-Pyramimonas_sp.AAC.1